MNEDVLSPAQVGVYSSLSRTMNSGRGSGNFGHAGRPGEVGGLSSGGGSDGKITKSVIDEYVKTLSEGKEAFRRIETAGSNKPDSTPLNPVSDKDAEKAIAKQRIAEVEMPIKIAEDFGKRVIEAERQGKLSSQKYATLKKKYEREFKQETGYTPKELGADTLLDYDFREGYNGEYLERLKLEKETLKQTRKGLRKYL